MTRYPLRRRAIEVMAKAAYDVDGFYDAWDHDTSYQARLNSEYRIGAEAALDALLELLEREWIDDPNEPGFRRVALGDRSLDEAIRHLRQRRDRRWDYEPTSVLLFDAEPEKKSFVEAFWEAWRR